MMPEKNNRPKSVTATDVAKRAGVSQSTVSRVFSKDCKIQIHNESRKRVLQAAEDLGYAPNAIAQIMASGRSGIVGILVSSYFNVFYYNVLQLLTNTLKRYGLRTMVFTSDPTDDINVLLQNLYQYQVDGVIITSSALSHHVTDHWVQKGMPVVLFNGYLEGLNISAVQSDQRGSGKIMADYLVGAGHQRFAYISTENSPHHNYPPRQEGFLAGLQAHGVQDCQIVPAEYSYESGLEAGRKILQCSAIPTAIFCSGDLNAFGVIDALRADGRLKVGRDISVTGYDTPVLGQLQGYSLTALAQQSELLAYDAVELLLRLMQQPDLPPEVITRPMQLILRESSCPPPA